MAFTHKVRLTRTPTSIQTDGTYWYVGCDDGKILKITISDNTTVTLASFIGRKITALVSDGTSLYVGLDDGAVEKVTIANGAVAELEPKSKHRYAIVSMHYYTSTLYFGMNNGEIKSRGTT